MLEDTLSIIFVAVFTAVLGEGITWLLVYRTDKYKRLTSEVDKHTKKLERKRDTTSETILDKSAKKRLGMRSFYSIILISLNMILEKQEERLKNFTRDLQAVKFKSLFATGIIFTSVLSACNSVFDGRVVCKLPFVPISWFQGMSHRNLHGNDYTDCSFIFLYIICTMTIRQNIQKMFGFAPSRAANAYPSNN
ncbi:unnamed protein product [Hymenolepis diminuta]|uniref:Calcium load-activated calcium channel n=1 Tax=Hymenolepis diminuta TaxID=6216 RepID=A0A0R3SKW9_HYMDI|nr:unnamed protein product [Hymenolepis diminuta]